jgi:hypothetical protein
MSHQDGFGNNGPEASRLSKPDDGDDRVQKKTENVAHACDAIKLNKLKNSMGLWNSPTTGNDHHAAVRALAYKWIRIMFRCWKARTPYDDSLYVKSLTKRGSNLAEGLNKPGPDSTVEILSKVCESRA